MPKNPNSMQTREKIVIIFCKVPAPGRVKTRLTRDTCLLPTETAIIAEAMLKDTFIIAVESNADRIVMGFTPREDRPIIEKIVDGVKKDHPFDKPVSFVEQAGSNFDERFGSVISAISSPRFKDTVVLGGDLPYLPPEMLNQAFSLLYEFGRKDTVVLGPSSEGGIYLVGITQEFDPESFKDHHLFGVGVELSQFVKFCQQFHKNLILLPPLNDIDVEQDLVSLLVYIEAYSSAKKSEGFHFPQYTASIIQELGLKVVDQPGETRHRKIEKTRAGLGC